MRSLRFSTHTRTARQAALSLAAAVLFGAASVSAQAPAAPSPLTAEVRAEVVDSLAAAMVRFYAVADTGALIAAHLQGRLRAGAYDGLTQPARFADALTMDLRAINGDRHLSVVPRREGGALPMGRAALAPLNDTPPGYDGTLGPRTSSIPLSPEEARSPALLAARRSNYQMPRVEVLPGNVGYVEFRGFAGGSEPIERMVDALRFVEHTDALILDVRDHRGGSPFMTTLLVSHFFGPATVHLVDVAVRAANQRSQVWTLPRVPGPQRPDVPLYVLTSRGTISAGEALAFALKNTGRGTVVGERTHGAGRNNPSFDVGHGFTASISVSVVTDPRTGAQFEGHGVQPDVTAPPRDALAVAHELALKEMAEREDAPARKRELALTAELVAARRSPRAVHVPTLRRYAGTYEGGRTVTVENGTLVWRRLPEHLGQELVAISDTVFAPASLPAMRIAFEPDGAEFRLRQVPPSGEALTFARTGPPADIPSEYR